MTKNMNQERKFTIKAILVQDSTRVIHVEIKPSYQVQNLKVLIGDQMKTNFPEMFEQLDDVKAHTITLGRDKDC